MHIMYVNMLKYIYPDSLPSNSSAILQLFMFSLSHFIFYLFHAGIWGNVSLLCIICISHNLILFLVLGLLFLISYKVISSTSKKQFYVFLSKFIFSSCLTKLAKTGDDVEEYRMRVPCLTLHLSV